MRRQEKQRHVASFFSQLLTALDKNGSSTCVNVRLEMNCLFRGNRDKKKTFITVNTYGKNSYHIGEYL